MDAVGRGGCVKRLRSIAWPGDIITISPDGKERRSSAALADRGKVGDRIMPAELVLEGDGKSEAEADAGVGGSCTGDGSALLDILGKPAVLIEPAREFARRRLSTPRERDPPPLPRRTSVKDVLRASDGMLGCRSGCRDEDDMLTPAVAPLSLLFSESGARRLIRSSSSGRPH